MTARYACFVLVKTYPAWLALTRKERAAIAGESLGSTLPKDCGVSLRHFDGEAFSGRCTDVLMFETEDLHAYYLAIERLRDTPLITVPYFKVVDIFPTIEDGYLALDGPEKDN